MGNNKWHSVRGTGIVASTFLAILGVLLGVVVLPSCSAEIDANTAEVDSSSASRPQRADSRPESPSVALEESANGSDATEVSDSQDSLEQDPSSSATETESPGAVVDADAVGRVGLSDWTASDSAFWNGFNSDGTLFQLVGSVEDLSRQSTAVVRATLVEAGQVRSYTNATPENYPATAPDPGSFSYQELIFEVSDVLAGRLPVDDKRIVVDMWKSGIADRIDLASLSVRSDYVLFVTYREYEATDVSRVVDSLGQAEADRYFGERVGNYALTTPQGVLLRGSQGFFNPLREAEVEEEIRLQALEFDRGERWDPTVPHISEADVRLDVLDKVTLSLSSTSAEALAAYLTSAPPANLGR